MSLEMQQAATVLQNKLDLPAGYYVKHDKKTDNIIVANEKLGFCVSTVYVRDHPNEGYLEPVKAYLAQLRDITDHPEKYDSATDVEGSLNAAYAAVRARMANGGPRWEPK